MKLFYKAFKFILEIGFSFVVSILFALSSRADDPKFVSIDLQLKDGNENFVERIPEVIKSHIAGSNLVLDGIHYNKNTSRAEVRLIAEDSLSKTGAFIDGLNRELGPEIKIKNVKIESMIYGSQDDAMLRPTRQ
jgi:hypothetical protein